MFKHSRRLENRVKNVIYSIGYANTNKLKGFIIDVHDVHDCQINWDIGELYTDGYMIFEDSLGVFSTTTHTSSMIFTIETIDSFNVSEKLEFAITSIQQHREDAYKHAMRIEFIDSISFYMLNCYYGKGYTNSKVSDIIKDYLTNDKIISPNGRLYFQPFNIQDTAKTYDSIVVPQHNSFFSFVYSREIRDAFLVYNTRKGMNLLDINNIQSNILKLSKDISEGIVFTMDDTKFPMEVNNPFIIHSLKIQSIDALSNVANLPVMLTRDFDYANKKSIDEVIAQPIVAQSLDSSSVPSVGAYTVGTKQLEFQNSSNAINRIYATKLLENVLIEIEVTGSLMYNLLFGVSVNIPTHAQLSNTTISNKSLSGEYTILKIVDKFSQGSFNQFLTLGRIGQK